jgi:cobalt-zinc-cadmium resistance protein CzcA
VVGALLRFALQQRTLFLALGLVLAGVGVYLFTNLRIEAYPDISDTQAVVISLYPGHAAEEVEQQVTVPIERALNNVPRVIARRSRTIFGLSVVELTFDDPTDDYFARQLVVEKLRDAVLPNGVTPQLGPLTSGIGEMYRYRLEGAGNDTMKLRELQNWVVIPRLLQVPGVADVAPFGGLVKQYQIEIDPFALEKYRFSVKQIADAINANNQNGGGAQLDNRQQSMVIRGVGLIQSVSDIENIVLDAANGVPISVRDIGRVSLGAAPQTGIFGINDESGEHQNGAEGIVLMRRWENPSEVLQKVKAALDELNDSRLPAGVKIVSFYDRTDLVSNTLRTVSRTLIEGLVIVIAVLLLFLGNVRGALLTALTIPLSLLFAFICMYLAAIPANLLSLGAIDFGIIVDGTLVMVEHIVHRLEEHEREGRLGDTVRAVQTAALEIAQPIFFASLAEGDGFSVFSKVSRVVESIESHAVDLDHSVVGDHGFAGDAEIQSSASSFQFNGFNSRNGRRRDKQTKKRRDKQTKNICVDRPGIFHFSVRKERDLPLVVQPECEDVANLLVRRQ